MSNIGTVQGRRGCCVAGNASWRPLSPPKKGETTAKKKTTRHLATQRARTCEWETVESNLWCTRFVMPRGGSSDLGIPEMNSYVGMWYNHYDVMYILRCTCPKKWFFKLFRWVQNLEYDLNSLWLSCTVCLPSTTLFPPIFMLCALFVMSLKGMVESSLLSKDEPLTHNIGTKLWGVEFLERGPKIQKLAIHFTSKFHEGIYSQPPKERFWWNLFKPVLSLYYFDLDTYAYQNRHFGCHPGILPISKTSERAMNGSTCVILPKFHTMQ